MQLSDSSNVITMTSEDSTNQTLMLVITDDSVTAAPSASGTSSDFRPLPIKGPSRQVNNEVESKVQIISLPYLYVF